MKTISTSLNRAICQNVHNHCGWTDQKLIMKINYWSFTYSSCTTTEKHEMPTQCTQNYSRNWTENVWLAPSPVFLHNPVLPVSLPEVGMWLPQNGFMVIFVNRKSIYSNDHTRFEPNQFTHIQMQANIKVFEGSQWKNKERERERERGREREKEREWEREGERGRRTNRQTDRQKERDRDRGRQRERQGENERERERERERDRERKRERERENTFLQQSPT